MEDSDFEIEYDKETAHFKNGEICFEILVVSELPIEYLAQLESKREEISGRRLWPGSSILGQYLVEMEAQFEGKNVLELGAGTGVCGMLSRRLGAAFVAVTDGDSECISLINQNFQNNGFRDDQYIHSFFLKWGDTVSTAAFSEACPIESFDLIVAGDVLYKKELLDMFFPTARSLLTPHTGRMYLCHLPRAGVTHSLVQEAAGVHGFSFSIQSKTTIHHSEEVEMDDITNSEIYLLTLTE